MQIHTKTHFLFFRLRVETADGVQCFRSCGEVTVQLGWWDSSWRNIPRGQTGTWIKSFQNVFNL